MLALDLVSEHLCCEQRIHRLKKVEVYMTRHGLCIAQRVADKFCRALIAAQQLNKTKLVLFKLN